MAKVRVAILGTVGKAVFLDPDATNGAQIGLNLRLPDGTVPSLERLAEIICSYCDTPVAPVTNIWKYLLEIPENLRQLAELDCCGIIVRQCETDPIYEWDTEYNPSKLADIEVWAGTPSAWDSRGAAREGAVIKEISAVFRTGNTVQHYLVGPDPFFDWKSRTFDPDTGAQLSADGGAASLGFNNAGWQFVPKEQAGSIYALVCQAVGGGVGVSRWYVDGTMGPAPRSFYQVSGVYDGYHCVYDGRGLYVPGYGVYSAGRGETFASRAINFWAAETPTTMPAANASAGLLWDTGMASGGIYLYDFDEDGNVYGVATTPSTGIYEVFSLTPAPSITVRWRFNLPASPTGVTGYGINPITLRIGGRGRYLLHVPTGLADPSRIYVFDISSGTEAVSVGSFDTLIPAFTNALQDSKILSPCEIAVGRVTEIWEFCQGLILVDPGLTASFVCTFVQSGNEHITVTDGDAQLGPPTVTLNDLPISKITGLQDALDSLGAASGGILPMTTGEVPPVLVYGPDGSLIYFEV